MSAKLSPMMEMIEEFNKLFKASGMSCYSIEHGSSRMKFAVCKPDGKAAELELHHVNGMFYFTKVNEDRGEKLFRTPREGFGILNGMLAHA